MGTVVLKEVLLYGHLFVDNNNASHMGCVEANCTCLTSSS